MAAIAAVACGVYGFGPAHAATLNLTIATDNFYTVYLSTNDGVLGNAATIGSGANWQANPPNTFSQPLGSSPVYFIQIVGGNDGAYSSGNPAALLGSFSISGSGYTFANGGTSLLTDTTNWLASNSATVSPWSTPNGTPVSLGTNGGANIWTNNYTGAIPGISGTAQWIWSQDPTSQYAFFSTEIVATPLPTAWIMLLGGLLSFGWLAYRRPKHALASPAV